MMSGIRKEPPISTNSPRETITSGNLSPCRLVVKALSIKNTAAALLLTTIASSAPESERNSLRTFESRVPRFPVLRSYSSVEYELILGKTFANKSADKGARPKLV